MLYIPTESPKIDVPDLQSSAIPCPTVLFIKPGHLDSLTSLVLQQAKCSPLLNMFAWRHKQATLDNGFFTKESLWDRLLFDSARAKVIGEGAGSLRAIIVSGGKSSFPVTNGMLIA
jgi:long-chain acyl-CoA synthetase